MNNTKPQDIAALLGQATPRPWKVTTKNVFDETRVRGINNHTVTTFGIEADAQLTVTAVNALPAFLKLREAAAAVMVECAVDTPPSLGAIANLDAAVVKVDTTLGLSSEPSQTPVDTL